MAKPPRQSGRKVSFTPEAAKRIASAVMKVEGGSRDQGAGGLRTSGGGDELVRATFTGSWEKGAEKTVNDAVLTAVQYKAKNYQISLSAPGDPMTVHLGYAAGEWVLVSFDYTELSGYMPFTQQVLARNEDGELVWLDTTACT